MNECQCGCGGSPKGPKSRFLPGHDAKYHSGMKSARGLAAGYPDSPAKLRVIEGGAAQTWTHKKALDNPHTITAKRMPGGMVCSRCGFAIRKLRKNEGPETLRALLSF